VIGRERQFLERFQSNPNAHGLQQTNGSYLAIRQSITNSLLEDHFTGKQTLGIYTTSPANNTSKFLCIDIDDDHQTTEFNRLLHYLNINNLVYLRESVRPGRMGHVWLLFDRPVATALVHRMGIYACMLAGLKAESFPKQTSIKPEQLGNLVRLPLGVHKKTGQRGLFLDCPDDDQLDWFLQQSPNSGDLVVTIASNLPALVEKRSRRLQNKPKTPLLAEFPSHWEFKESGSGELIGQCPCCASKGFDRSCNNLCVNTDKNVLFCHRGCRFEDILQALRIVKV
jgi:hypothetical protein